MVLDLNNQHQIADAMNTQQSEVEVLYWILEDYLYENKKQAESILRLLLYIAKHNSKLIACGLKQRQRERLQEITHEIYGGGSTAKREVITIKSGFDSKTLPFKKEKELKIFLAKNPEVISRALGEDIQVRGVEVETDFEYRCDIVVESEFNFYPIELKIGAADHAVVSQIQKYCFFFYRQLRYNHYKDIQGVVFANGFCDWSINELRRCGTWIFAVHPEGENGITLNRIH